jgi:hypothetical protein
MYYPSANGIMGINYRVKLMYYKSCIPLGIAKTKRRYGHRAIGYLNS